MKNFQNTLLTTAFQIATGLLTLQQKINVDHMSWKSSIYISAVSGKLMSAGRSCHSRRTVSGKLKTYSDKQSTFRLCGIINAKSKPPCNSLYTINETAGPSANGKKN